MISAVLKSLNELGYVVWGAAWAGQIEMEAPALGRGWRHKERQEKQERRWALEGGRAW
jgi:hypothetical protein